MMQASVHGRLGRDPETRTTTTGKPMATCSVAVDVTANNAEADETIWIRLVAFGRLADQLARHRQGDMVSASGRLVLNRWIGRDGEERTGWALTIDSLVSARTVRPGGGKRKKDQSRNSCSEENQRLTTQTPDSGFDDSIPF